MLDNLEIRKCILVVLAILLAMVVIVGLASRGHDAPGLRQIIGFIFLTFIPGTLILRILKVHSLSTTESLVYSAGLSLAFVMFSGVLVNSVFSFFGVPRPISIFPLMAAFTGFILVLGALAYARDRDFSAPAHPASPLRLSPPYLLLVLLPLLAILGALLVNYYQNNLLLLIFIAAVAIIVGLVAFGRFIPEGAYPLAIVVIAIALLYHSTLSSSFILGWDIQAEYWVQNLVTQSGYWYSASPGNLNTALSLVMLAPIYSVILNMEAVWVFKIIYPLFFCLVPLALFHIYREQMGGKGAFFAAFFFMTVLFFTEMLSLSREQVAELFFALLILLMVDAKMTRGQKSALAIIFVVSLPVSHYGLAYIGFAYFLIGWLLLQLMKSRTAVKWWGTLVGRFNRSPANPGVVASTPERFPASSVLSITLVCLYLVFTLAWFIYTSSGTAFSSVVKIPQSILASLSEFSSPLTRESLVGVAIGIDFPSVSPLGKVFRVIQYATQFLIIAGFFRLLLKPRDFKFRAEFMVLVMVSFLILLACIVVPNFSTPFEVQRFYQITLLLLSPLCILGGEAIWLGLSGLFKSGALQLKIRRRLAPVLDSGSAGSVYLGFLALAVLIPYFLFNIGFIFEVARSERYDVVDTPSSVALSSYRMDMKSCNYQERVAHEWLAGAADLDTPIYADVYGALPISSLLLGRVRAFPLDAGRMPVNTYIFLKTWNIEKKEAPFMVSRGEQIWFEHISFDALPELSRLISSKDLVYNNGGAQVLAP